MSGGTGTAHPVGAAPGVREFRLPDLGEGLAGAEIVRWLVEVGDEIAVDQPVAEVETAKSQVEVPCPYAGVVRARFGEPGQEVPVCSPLVHVAPAAGPATEPAAGPATVAGGGAGEEPAPGAEEAPREAAGSGNVLVGYGTGGPAAARRRRVRTPPHALPDSLPNTATPAPAPAASDALAPSSDAPRGDAGGPTARAATAAAAAPTGGTARRGGGGGLPAAAAPGGTGGAGTGAAGTDRRTGPVPVISPLVRRLARERGLDLRALAGSGPNGLILRADVERASRPAPEPSPPSVPADPSVPAAPAASQPTPQPTAQPTPQPAPTAAGQAEETRIPLRGALGAMAEKLTRSRTEIPDATCWLDVDATELLAARQRTGLPLLALLARVCVTGLRHHPELNATVDTRVREIVRLPEVHLGFAAQTDRGLRVPVVRRAHALTTRELGAELGRLTEAARAGTLAPAELTGSTFTLNNYGVLGVDGSTPILNHPEAAMLGVGRVVERPWAHRGQLALRHVTQLSLTFDHRVCDGATAAAFLRHVADRVADPMLLLRDA